MDMIKLNGCFSSLPASTRSLRNTLKVSVRRCKKIAESFSSLLQLFTVWFVVHWKGSSCKFCLGKWNPLVVFCLRFRSLLCRWKSSHDVNVEKNTNFFQEVKNEDGKNSTERVKEMGDECFVDVLLMLHELTLLKLNVFQCFAPFSLPQQSKNQQTSSVTKTNSPRTNRKSFISRTERSPIGHELKLLL